MWDVTLEEGRCRKVTCDMQEGGVMCVCGGGGVQRGGRVAVAGDLNPILKDNLPDCCMQLPPEASNCLMLLS